MKLFVFMIMLAVCCRAEADCPSMGLKGYVSIKECPAADPQCAPSEKALYRYIDAKPDAGPTTLSISTHGSPWHLYDGDYRILEVEEVAAMVRQQGNKIKRVILVASWSGTAPDSRSDSLAKKLSMALGGMPVSGQDGFVWVSPKGKLRTTHQAFTGRVSGPYRVAKSDDLMVSLVPGWVMDLEPEFVKAKNSAGIFRVGAAKEIFLLCPEGALKSYDEAAALRDPIAAFNAAIMRLERDKPGDRAAALVLLEQSAAQGDKKAENKLKSLAKTAPAI